jgi:hypothetical protein
MYSRFADEILTLFPTINREKGIFAIGRKSEDRMIEMGKNTSYVHHPSHGGSSKCREQITLN